MPVVLTKPELLGPPDREAEFQGWYAQRATALGLNPNPDDPRHQYDYRAAHAAGAEPDPVSHHWPSQFKQPGHPNRFVNGEDTMTGQRLTPGVIVTKPELFKPTTGVILTKPELFPELTEGPGALGYARMAGGMAARVGIPIAAGAVAALPEAALVPATGGTSIFGIPAAVLAASTAASIPAETVARFIEGSPPATIPEYAVNAALQAIPAAGTRYVKGPVSGAITRAAGGAVIGAGSQVPLALTSRGELPSRAEVGTGAALGALTGGVIGGIEGYARGKVINTGLIPGASDLPPPPPPPGAPPVEAPPGTGPIPGMGPIGEGPPAAAGQPTGPDLPSGGLPPSRGVSSPQSVVPPGPAPVQPETPQNFPAGAAPQAAPLPAAMEHAESPTSAEGIARLESEKKRGIQYGTFDVRSGKLTPLAADISRVDITPKGGTWVTVQREGAGPWTLRDIGRGVNRKVLTRRLAELNAPLTARNITPSLAKPVEVAPSVQGPTGNDVNVFGITDRTNRYAMRFRAVPLDSLEVDDPAVQPRNPDRVPRQERVLDLARKLDADAWLAGNEELDRGTPIVGPDSSVESGNTRTLALRYVKENDPERYQNFMSRQRQRAAEVGIDPNELGPDTVIVRERLTPVADRRAFADEANGRVSAGMAPAETAHMDAQRLPTAAIDAFQIGGSQTVDEAIRGGRNAQVVEAFVQSLPAAERGGVRTADGQGLTPGGVQRLKAALLARAFPGESGARLVQSATESADSNVRNVEAGIFGALGKLGQAADLVREGHRQPDLDFTEDLARAVERLSHLRSQGEKVSDYMRQGGMFAEAPPSPTEDALLTFFDENKGSGAAIRRGLERLAQAVIDSPEPGQKSLLGGGGPQEIPRAGLLTQALKEAGGAPLFGEGGERGSIPLGGEKIIKGIRTLGSFFKGAAQEARERRMRALGGEEEPEPRLTGQTRTLGRMGMEGGRSGTEEATGPALEFDAQGRPIGRLSSRKKGELAPSLLEKLDTPEEARAYINERAKQMQTQIGRARRGRQSLAETAERSRPIYRELADLAGTQDVETFTNNLRRRNEAINAEQGKALLDFVTDTTNELADATEAAKRTGSDEDMARVFKAQAMLDGLMPQTAGAIAEAGRMLRMLREAKTGQRAISAVVKQLKKERGGEARTQEFLDYINMLDGDPLKINRAIRAYTPSTVGDKAFEWWMNWGLLSGPTSHTRNVISNTIQIVAKPTERVLTGRPGEAVADAYGIFTGLSQGLRAGLVSFLSEVPSSGATKINERQGLQHAVKGPIIGRVARFPGDAMMAADEAQKAVLMNSELHALAYRQASHEGFTGPSRWARMTELVSNPQESEHLRDQAWKVAHYRTQQAPLGDAGQAVIKFRDSLPGVRYIIPFVRFPMNNLKMGIEYSPFGFVNVARKVAGEARESGITPHGITHAIAGQRDEIGRAVLGSLIAGSVMTLYQRDLITGDAPDDPEERRAWRIAGKAPYSVKIGDEWVSYQALGPFAFPIGVTADAAHIWDRLEQEDAASKIIAMTAGAIGENMLNATWLSGLANFMEAINDWQHKGVRWARFLVAPAVPNILGQTAKSFDPVVRNPQTITQMWESRLPGRTENVDPLRDAFGEPITRGSLTKSEPAASIERLLSPFPVSHVRTDPARKELERLLFTPGSPSHALGETQLTPKQYDTYVARSGALAHGLVSRAMRMPFYRGSDEIKRALLAEAFSIAREKARKQLRLAGPETMEHVRERHLKGVLRDALGGSP